METFVKCMFWMQVVAVVIGLFTLVVAEYPRKREASIGLEIVSVLIIAGIGAWAGFLTYWR